MTACRSWAAERMVSLAIHGIEKATVVTSATAATATTTSSSMSEIPFWLRMVGVLSGEYERRVAW